MNGYPYWPFTEKVQTYLELPEFSPLPKTDAADCQENIERWEKTNPGKLDRFTRIENGKRRFIRAEDLRQVIEFDRKIKGVDVTFRYTQHVHANDHYCPLWFTPWKRELLIILNGQKTEITSYSQLMRLVKDYKLTQA